MELGRYIRQESFAGLGQAGQARLARARVCVLGCGGLGSTAANLLARAGVGRLRLIDSDLAELHNLHRQLLYSEADVAARRPKAQAAAAFLAAANSAIALEPIVARFAADNALALLHGCDLVVDCVDNLEARYLLNDAAHKLATPWIYGAAVAASGMTMTIVPGRTPCLRCVFPDLPPAGVVPGCAELGVIGPAPAAVAALQVAEALKLLAGVAPPGGLLVLDLWSNSFDRLAIGSGPSPACPTCQGRYEYLVD